MPHRIPRIPHRFLGGLLAVPLLLGPLAPRGVAQEEAAACEQGRISRVFIDNHSVFDLTDPDLSERFAWAYRLANGLHVPTQEEVVRREVLFTEGDCYDVERLRDSERLLRELPFIADVDIFGVRQPDGSIHVIVDTQDEWSTRVDARVGSDGVFGVEELRLREDNLLGSGRHASVFFESDEEKQVYGLSFFTPQLLASRWDAGVEAGKTPVGYLVSEAITYPFVGQVGRWAFRQSIRHHDRYFQYLMPAEDDDGLVAAWYPERRQSFDLGGAYRWGTRGFNRTLLGAALVGEWISYPEGARRAGEPDPGASSAPLPELPMDSVASVRLMLLTGQRNVYYVRRRALDTVNGTEDVRLGVEAEVAIGPSLPGISSDQDLALDLGLFAATEIGESTLAGTNLLVEARRSYDAPPERNEWSDVFAQLSAWTYWRPSPDSRHTLVGAVSAAGGWHNRVPFQLTLGSDVGLRGHPEHLYPGGRRIVASLEQRSYLGWPLPDLLDLGAVAFVDVGKMWAGDAPFGVDSPVRVDAGVGLRAAFPPGSRQTFRVDVGVPVHGGVGFGDVVLSVGVGQLLGFRAAGQDPQLRRTVRGSTASLFTQPGRR